MPSRIKRDPGQTEPAEPAEARAWGMALWVPPADVLVTDDDVIVRIELAGTAPGDVRLRASEGELIVAGIRREPRGDPPRRIERMEIAFGPFERAIPLPLPVRPEAAEARLLDGLLEVSMPVAEPRPPASRGHLILTIVVGDTR